MTALEEMRLLAQVQLAIEELRRVRGTDRERECKLIVEGLFKQLFNIEVKV
jgi:hypothetical protein